MAEVRFLPPAAKYNKTNYELAYTVEYEGEKIIVVVMAGTRENFYDELKRYMK